MKIIIFVMNPDKNFERRVALTELLGKTPFQFEFMSINDDIELTPAAISKNHDSKKSINALGRDLSRGELASTLNHLLCFKKFLNSDDDIAIILEDDADFIVDEFNRVINLITKIIDENKPKVYLLTPVISYLNHNSIGLDEDYKVAEVVQSLDSAGYIVNRKTAEKLLNANSKAWFIMDDWVRYRRHANVGIFSVIPPIINQNINVFESNLMDDRNKAVKSRSLKYIFSRLGYKIIADGKKYCWLIPFKGYVRNKDV
jgi:GR25 family glycosyltransferase involved in LPS biosynthesis